MAEAREITLTGTDFSEELKLDGSTIVQIAMSGAWDASDLWVQERNGPARTWRDKYDKFGDRVRFIVRANQAIDVDPAVFQYTKFVRFYSAQAQTSPRTIEILVATIKEVVALTST
jgi:hypothetical protein